MALQKLRGGEVYVICGRQGLSHAEPMDFSRALHAVLRLPSGEYMDFGTVGSAEDIIASFNREECLGKLAGATLRPIEDDDLDEAPRDQVLIEEITKILATAPRRSKSLAPWPDYNAHALRKIPAAPAYPGVLKHAD
jgi:hypothetical protein